MSSNIKPIVSVFDSDFIPFYVGFTKKGEEDKSLEQCIANCDDFISNINRYNKADYYVGYLTQSKCFRYDINPSYKANRKYDNMPKYLKELKQHLRDKHNFISQEGYEADDLVISFKAQNNQYKSILVSPDKDILNLVGKHLNPRKMEFKRTSESEATEFFWKSMIKGDTIDGIAGLKGKGEVFAEKLLANLYDDYESVRNLVFEEYLNQHGEYEGIKEFTKNYLSLKLVETVPLETIKLNEIDKIVCE